MCYHSESMDARSFNAPFEKSPNATGGILYALHFLRGRDRQWFLEGGPCVTTFNHPTKKSSSHVTGGVPYTYYDAIRALFVSFV